MSVFKLSRRMISTVGAYKKVFCCSDGEKVLVDLMKRAEMVGIPSKKETPTEWAFAEGKRACVLEILQMIGVDEEQSLKLFEKGAE